METSRSRMIASALMAASLQLGGRRVEVRTGPEVNLADKLAERLVRSRFARSIIGTVPEQKGYPYRNGGERRKNAIRARRMNNAGHCNRWSARHA